MSWRTPLLAVALMSAVLTGCQSYQRRPLDLAAYGRQWIDRSLDDESIRGYADSLIDATMEHEPFDSRDGLSLWEAQAVALHFNPRLRLARAAAEVPLANAQEAGWWPDPRFEAELLRFVDRGDKTRFKRDGPSIDGINAGGIETTPVGFRRVAGDYIDDPWIVGAGLSITVPLSGRLAVEKDMRWSEYEASWRRILVEEWTLITELRSAWLAWSSWKERIDVTRAYVGQLEAIATMAKQLMAAGEMKPTESRLFFVELARRRASLLAFERQEQESRLGLLSLLGLAPDAPVTLYPELSLSTTAIPTEGRRELLLLNHPEIKAAQAEYESAEQQLRWEIRRQYPDLDIGPSYSFEEGLARFGLGLGFVVPLWNRNRQAIAEAYALREQARVRAETVLERKLSELAGAQTRLEFASRQRRELLEVVTPLVERQVEDSRTLLELGEVDVLLLRDALTGLLETKLDLLDVTLNEQRAVNKLQQMLEPRWFTPPTMRPGEDCDESD